MFKRREIEWRGDQGDSDDIVVTLRTDRWGRISATWRRIRRTEDWYRVNEEFTSAVQAQEWFTRMSIDALEKASVHAQTGAPASDTRPEQRYSFVAGGVTDVDQPRIPPRGRARSDQVRGCDGCTLKAEWPQLTTPCMKIDHGAEADVLILGEAPGEVEDMRGEPFVGPAGSKLRQVLPHRQMWRVDMSNATRCRPPKNRNPTVGELHACSIHLENDILAHDYKAILGLGGVPLSRFLSGATITQIHGLKFPIQVGDKVLWYYPTLHPSFLLYTAGNRGRDESPALPIFENDIKRFFREVDSWPQARIERPSPEAVIWARGEEEARGWCSKLKRDKPLGLDIETNNLRPNAKGARIMTASVSDGATTVAWSVFHPEQVTLWGLPLLLELSEDLRWVAHSAGFELGWLQASAARARVEWEPHAGFDDSMTAARLYHRRHTALNLGILTRIICGTDIKALSTVNVERIQDEPLSKVIPYNGLDAWGCWRVFDECAPQIDERNYTSLIETIASCTAMQLAGLDVDQDAAHDLHVYWQDRADRAAAHAQTIYEVRQYCRDRNCEFRISSDNDVGEVLTKYSKLRLPLNNDGSYKTTDEVLTGRAPDHPLVIDVLEWRHAHKMDGTYVSPVIDAPTKTEDGKLHPSYSTVLTRTLRTSAEDPSIQNYPKRRDFELRRPIIAPPGQIFAAADFSSLEARILAMASRDRELVRSTIEHEDIHYKWLDFILDRYPPYLDRLAARVAHDGSFESIRKGGRDGVIKSDFVFASFYGSIAQSVAARADIPLDIAMDILGVFWNTYPGVQDWLKRQRMLYREHGVAVDLLGRERYAILWGNEPINLPIQGTAARLVLDAQDELHQISVHEKDPYLLPRINIHDDLIFCLPDRDQDLLQYIEYISEVMTKVRYDWQTVPLAIDFRVGYNWAELESCYKYEGSYVH